MFENLKKVCDADNWIFVKEYPQDLRTVNISIHFKYPDITDLLDFEPGVRIKKIDLDHKEKFQTLIGTGYFNDYKLLGTNRRPKGIATTLNFSLLAQIDKLDCVDRISINRLDGAKKVKEKPVQKYFTVKMTVAVVVEGQVNGMQTIEERLVLIKAKSFDDAYEKLERTKDDYTVPYLNTNGEVVRWNVESFDDCYETDIQNIKELNSPEGIEVYSKLKSRRFKKGDI